MKFKNTQKEIKKKIEIALGMLLKNDAFLLKHDVNERSISHKLAEYLQQLFPDYHVDCEYNWQVDDPHNKKILFTAEEERRFYPKTNEEKVKDRNAHTVFPDIIIHHRGNNDTNLLIVEMKKSTNSSDSARDRDRLKLKRYKEKFGYKYTLFLDIPTGANFNYENWRRVTINFNE